MFSLCRICSIKGQDLEELFWEFNAYKREFYILQYCEKTFLKDFNIYILCTKSPRSTSFAHF